MRPLRRTDRSLADAATLALLDSGEYGVLATVDVDGQAHATPLNYVHVLEGDTHVLYFHAGPAGQKLDNIDHEPRVAFTVVGPTQVLPAQFSTAYSSVMVFGTMRFVEDAHTKTQVLLHIANKYAPDFHEEAERYIARAAHNTTVLRLDVTHISGKARTMP